MHPRPTHALALHKSEQIAIFLAPFLLTLAVSKGEAQRRASKESTPPRDTDAVSRMSCAKSTQKREEGRRVRIVLRPRLVFGAPSSRFLFVPSSLIKLQLDQRNLPPCGKKDERKFDAEQ